MRAGGLWLLGAAGAAVVVLDRFPPETSSFYPVCPIFAYTGLLCPGCGGTRALAALMHGQFGAAVHWNGLVVGLVALGLVYVGMGLVRRALGRGIWLRIPQALVTGLAVVAVLFTVWRNLNLERYL